MIFRLRVSPSLTTSPGWATRWFDSSLMWIRPSRPSSTRTKAPKFTSLVTVPVMTSPMLYLATDSCHGSGWRRRMERLIRPRSWLMSMTSASTWSPISYAVSGLLTLFHDSSLLWTRPSIPPRSTKTPKGAMLRTVP